MNELRLIRREDVKKERKFNRIQAIEKFKRNLMLLKARILNQPISPDDDRTIQLHRDSNGEIIMYQIHIYNLAQVIML